MANHNNIYFYLKMNANNFKVSSKLIKIKLVLENSPQSAYDKEHEILST